MNSVVGQRQGGGVKRLVIKGFRPPSKLPENFEQDTWKKLQNSVRAVHNQRPVETSLEELYKACENLCTHKKAARLYTNLEQECRDHITEVQRNLVVGIASEHEVFLHLMDTEWRNHCDQMRVIRQILLHLDRTYVINTPGLPSLWDMGLNLFRDLVVSHAEIGHKLVGGLLKLVEKERCAEMVDRVLLKNLLNMLVSLQVYTSLFELDFLTETKSFYERKAKAYLEDTEVSQYLKYADDRLQEENDRVLHYLWPSTKKPLVACVEKQLLEIHVDRILEKGFDLLMNDNRQADLARMYSLFSLVDLLNPLKVSFTAYIKNAGGSIIGDPQKDGSMVSDLLAFKLKLDTLLASAFQSNPLFANGLKEAFEYFINLRKEAPAEYIAKFIDNKMRSGNKGTSEEELEQVLDRVLTLFRFVQGKDVFQAFYKRHLAKRLLHSKSASIDAEKSMISMLKTECGSHFTTKIEGMFKDIELSREMIASFRQSSKHREALGDIELNVNVLTSSYWPTYKLEEANLPHQMSLLQETFKLFYLKRYSGRKIFWQNALGSCVLKVRFKQGPKELIVSIFQAVVLLMFEDKSAKLSFAAIKEATAIEDQQLRRTLQALACGKSRVLLKRPKGRDVEDGDMFMWSQDFKSRRIRIKINSIQMKDTSEEKKKTHEEVFQDRQYQVDAAIVRIMKTRKQLKHTLLIAELLAQLKFPLKVDDIKRRIESLIEREYLERDPSDSQLYHYLA